MTPRPFTIKVADEVLADLRARLERVRWPDEVPDAAWRYGTSVAYMKELVEYWRRHYDWRAHESRLNACDSSRSSSTGSTSTSPRAGVGPADAAPALTGGPDLSWSSSGSCRC
jgi:hypothetical protein